MGSIVTGQGWSLERLAADVAALGVTQGDLVMVHASLRKVGPVQGGAAGLIAAIDRAVGTTGTWLMVLGAEDDHSWVNERPERDRAALLVDAEPFDARTTPADGEVGVLAEVFRTTMGTAVSDHPEGRFGARGPMATNLLTDVPWDDYYGPGSPLDRFLRAGGKVLRLGADLDTVTLIHHAEYLVDLPTKRRARRHRIVATPNGPELRVVECLDDSDGIVEWSGEDYFAIILREYLRSGRAATGPVGAAPSELIDGAELVAVAVDWMSANLT